MTSASIIKIISSCFFWLPMKSLHLGHSSALQRRFRSSDGLSCALRCRKAPKAGKKWLTDNGCPEAAYGGFLKWWVSPTNPSVFLLKMLILGWRLGKHPYVSALRKITSTLKICQMKSLHPTQNYIRSCNISASGPKPCIKNATLDGAKKPHPTPLVNPIQPIFHMQKLGPRLEMFHNFPCAQRSQGCLCTCNPIIQGGTWFSRSSKFYWGEGNHGEKYPGNITAIGQFTSPSPWTKSG